MNSFTRTKNISRYSYTVRRDDVSKKAGCNSVTINTRRDESGYSTPSVSLTLTVKEARALQNFLAETIED